MTNNTELKCGNLKQGQLIYHDELVNVFNLGNNGNSYVILAHGVEPRKGLSGITLHTGNPLDGINGISIGSLLSICKDHLTTIDENNSKIVNNIVIEHITAAIAVIQNYEHQDPKKIDLSSLIPKAVDSYKHFIKYVKHDYRRVYINNILKDIYSSKYIDEIKKEIPVLYKKYFDMDVSDKNEDFYRNQIYAIAYELVYNGFKFSDNGFPIPSNWKNIKVEDISIKKWIKDTHPQFTTLFCKLAK